MRAASADHDDLLAVTAKKLEALVGRVNPVSGAHAQTYPALWGTGNSTGFGQPAS